MKTKVSQEQGDNNATVNRKNYHENLDKETKYWIGEDAKYFLHQALSTPVMNVLAKTSAAYIEDLNGKKYLDLHGNGVHNAGFNNHKVVAAVKAQMDASLAFTPRRYTNLPAIKLAKKLVEITPNGLDRVLFCPGGSQAIEMAVMLAKQVTGKWKTISYWDSYHGTGFQASSIGGEEHFTVGQGPMVPGAFHVEFPNYYRNPWGYSDQEAINEEYLRQIKNILRRNPDVAAIIAEPISATPVIPSHGYWQQVQQLCEQYNILLIFDEIIEGFGRTGKMFASEHFVSPDILVLGKSLGGGLVPFAGIVTKEKYNTLQHRSIGHFTHEKNPLCCAAGLAEIEFIEENHLVENAEKLGNYLMDRLMELMDIYPIIGNIAGKGFHIGVDLVTDRSTKERAVDAAEKIMYHCLEQGVAFKIIEGNIITMRPSLILSKDDCDLIVSSLKSAFEAIKV
ncbi:aspartate aminotransferase family protein [Arenibacter aquaticus]|uniref:Aspartate aminotransferase family protein n=1 Tax=Arenibacter aquaticus TaxID=2489054 RepID=A0A430K854_9FLAO|nr:aspartate aminotransferase family protein [Arenibacter aquaticus]RTE55182.1 aspartate aminotransferase family protein [Arenibacter aquaticus]